MLTFIDFEYAGWDDPAKTVCDFFCQPAVPVPKRFIQLMSEAAAEGLDEPELLFRRIDVLMPVYQLKWICILLNEFLVTDGRRRAFASTGTDGEARKANQLAKARAMFNSVCCGAV